MNQNYKIDQKDMETLRKNSKSSKKAKNKAKEKPQVGTVVFYVIFILIAIAYFALILFGKRFLTGIDDIIDSLNPFSKAEGINSLLRIAGLCIMTLTIGFVLRFLIGKLVHVKSVTKKTGIAVIELLANLVKYVTFLVLVFLVLQALGVNTAEILAGLGILGLILGLGVTSLIEDIVAGIFIIVEKTFDVGDIIVVDGFRGTVVSIGIRSTKLADVGGDILTMRNSSIGSLVNLTDRISSAAVTFPIAASESIERVEAVIKAAQVEKIADKYPKMESGPLALGVCEITAKGVQNYLVVAGCKEDNKYEIERALLYEFKVIFDNNNIKLGAPLSIDDETA